MKPFINLKLSLKFAGIAVVMAAFSVSLTHLFIGLTFISFLAEAIIRKFTSPQRKEKQAALFQDAPLLLAGGLLFIMMLISTLYQGLSVQGISHALVRGFGDELKDFPLYLFGVFIFYAVRRMEGEPYLRTCLYIFGVALILSGLAATFSEFRLSKIVMGKGFIASAGNRPQHPSFLLGGFQFYTPIGFMNTHLTYGGLLLMYLPIQAGLFLQKLQSGKAQRALLDGFLLLIGFYLLWINHTRSAQLGALLVFSLLGLALVWKAPPRIRLALLISGLVLILAVPLLYFSSELVHRLGYKVFAVFNRHTDAFRPIIWAGTGELIANSPFFGVGPGFFQEATFAWREEFTRLHPDNWYFFQNTPSGHAHNDLLHLTAVGGIGTGLVFLGMIFLITKKALGYAFSPDGLGSKYLYLYCGLLALLPAGLFQCYFQDDEVVVFFWVLLGLTASETLGNSAQSKLPSGSGPET